MGRILQDAGGLGRLKDNLRTPVFYRPTLWVSSESTWLEPEDDCQAWDEYYAMLADWDD